jgi:hypothetical protein
VGGGGGRAVKLPAYEHKRVTRFVLSSDLFGSVIASLSENFAGNLPFGGCLDKKLRYKVLASAVWPWNWGVEKSGISRRKFGCATTLGVSGEGRGMSKLGMIIKRNGGT